MSPPSPPGSHFYRDNADKNRTHFKGLLLRLIRTVHELSHDSRCGKPSVAPPTPPRRLHRAPDRNFGDLPGVTGSPGGGASVAGLSQVSKGAMAKQHQAFRIGDPSGLRSSKHRRKGMCQPRRSYFLQPKLPVKLSTNGNG